MSAWSMGHERRVQSALTVIGAGLVLAYVGVFVRSADAGYDVWAAVLTAPVLVALSLPVLLRAGRAEGDRALTTLFVAALVLKLLASLVRYHVAFDVYGGVADAAGYARQGAMIAESLRAGDIGVTLTRPIPGTGFMQLATGMVFTITGPSTLSGFLVFSWFGYWGLFLCYRAARVGYPEGNARRYAILLFLLPSLMFWPSSIGKESWMLLGLGLSAYGAARLLQRRGGVGPLMAGLGAVLVVRPHMAVLVVVALAVAWLRRPAPAGRSAARPVAQAASLALLLVVGLAVLDQAERFFGIEDEGVAATSDVLDRTVEQTSGDGSAFQAPAVRTPVDLPAAIVTVLFRPLPHEAHNAQALLAALEGAALLGLVAFSAGRLRHLPRVAWRSPYLMFVAAYSLMFIIAFSNVGNFGILTRQRVQVLPFVLVLLFVAPAADRRAAADRASPPTGMRVFPGGRRARHW